MKQVNKTNCYLLGLVFCTLILITIVFCNISRINTLNSRCERLEKEILEIKKEAVSNDWQSLIQLQCDNK